MSSYSMNEIKGGLKVLIDGDPYVIVDNEYVKPGKGQAFNRVKVRNLKTGRTVEKTYRSAESLEAADVMDVEMQYLYKDGDFWAFMNPENFEQLSAGEAAATPSSRASTTRSPSRAGGARGRVPRPPVRRRRPHRPALHSGCSLGHATGGCHSPPSQVWTPLSSQRRAPAAQALG